MKSMGAPDAESAWFDQHPENIRRNQAAEMGVSLWAQVANWPGDEGRLSIFTSRHGNACYDDTEWTVADGYPVSHGNRTLVMGLVSGLHLLCGSQLAVVVSRGFQHGGEWHGGTGEICTTAF
jgi:hypothetical protein